MEENTLAFGVSQWIKSQVTKNLINSVLWTLFRNMYASNSLWKMWSLCLLTNEMITMLIENPQDNHKSG